MFICKLETHSGARWRRWWLRECSRRRRGRCFPVQHRPLTPPRIRPRFTTKTFPSSKRPPGPCCRLGLPRRRREASAEARPTVRAEGSRWSTRRGSSGSPPATGPAVVARSGESSPCRTCRGNTRGRGRPSSSHRAPSDRPTSARRPRRSAKKAAARSTRSNRCWSRASASWSPTTSGWVRRACTPTSTASTRGRRSSTPPAPALPSTACPPTRRSRCGATRRAAAPPLRPPSWRRRTLRNSTSWSPSPVPRRPTCRRCSPASTAT